MRTVARWVAMVGLAGCPRGGAPTILADEAALSEDNLNAVVAELAPLVEEVAGAAFISVPHARLGRASDVDRIVQREAERALAHLYPEAPAWLRDRMARGAAGAHVSGKYALHERILLVSPEAMVATAAAVPDDPLALDHVTRLVLAHELAHALQDQVAGIGADFDSAPHYDAFEALRGVTEGHANFVERRVAERLGLEAAQVALDGSQGWDEAGPKSAQSWPIWALYGQGRAFVDWHHARGGLERTWEVLHAPPQRSRTLFVPEEYGRERPVDEGLVARLAGAEASLSDGRWFAVSSPLVEMELRHRLHGVPVDLVEPWLAAIEAGAYRTASRGDRAATFFLLRRPSADALTPLEEGADAMAEARAVPGVRFRLDVAEASIDGADRALSVVGRPTDADGGPLALGAAAELHAMWAVRGDMLLIVETSGFRPGVRLRRAVEAVLAE